MDASPRKFHRVLSSLFLEDCFDLVVFEAGARSKVAFPPLLGIDEEVCVEFWMLAEVVHDGSLVGIVPDHDLLRDFDRGRRGLGLGLLALGCDLILRGPPLREQGPAVIVDPEDVEVLPAQDPVRMLEVVQHRDLVGPLLA